MKKLFLIFIALFMLNELSAQIRWGAKAGLNISGAKLSEGAVSETFDSKAGFHFGGVMEYSFSENLALQPELLYSSKNQKNESVTLTINEVQLPINLKLKFTVEKVKFFGTVGPYFAYGLSSHLKENNQSISNYDSERLGKAILNRFDMGLGIGVGVEISKVTIGIGYQKGLTNIYNIDDDTTLKTSNFMLSCGYFF